MHLFIFHNFWIFTNLVLHLTIRFWNIKQTLINNDFPNYIVDEQIKRSIKSINSDSKGNNNQTSKDIQLIFVDRFANTMSATK